MREVVEEAVRVADDELSRVDGELPVLVAVDEVELLELFWRVAVELLWRVEDDELSRVADDEAVRVADDEAARVVVVVDAEAARRTSAALAT